MQRARIVNMRKMQKRFTTKEGNTVKGTLEEKAKAMNFPSG